MFLILHPDPGIQASPPFTIGTGNQEPRRRHQRGGGLVGHGSARCAHLSHLGKREFSIVLLGKFQGTLKFGW